MTSHHLVICVAVLAALIGAGLRSVEAPAAAPAAAVEHYTVTSGDYTVTGLRIGGFPVRVPVTGHYVVPEGAEGPRPFALFLHGKHTTCYRSSDGAQFSSWPCPRTADPIPSHLGYRYLQRTLAQRGYATVSVMANGVDGQEDRYANDSGVAARSALAAGVRAIAQRVDPDIPVTSARTLRSISDEALASTSFTATVLSAAALIALLLGAVGLYGVIGYVVSQRTREIGVRIALGAAPARVRLMVLRQGLMLAGLGLAVGLGAAALLSRLLDSLLFEVDSHDPATFIGVSAILLAVTAVAAWVPARRASAVSPLEALRAE
jgi:hypothetical protein